MIMVVLLLACQFLIFQFCSVFIMFLSHLEGAFSEVEMPYMNEYIFRSKRPNQVERNKEVIGAHKAKSSVMQTYKFHIKS